MADRQRNRDPKSQRSPLRRRYQLRDWIKGQVTAIESGILSFEAVFMPCSPMTEGQ
jgi:hypothetical protein